MKNVRFILPLFALLSLAACSGQSGTAEKGTTANAVGAPPPEHGPMMGPHHGPGGPEGLLFVAMHDESLNLTADQKTKIKAALDEVKPKGPPPNIEAHRKELAAAIRAGKIDVAALEPKPPTDAEIEQHRTAMAKALTVLHDTLTKDQRTALVASIQKHRPMHEPGDEPKGDGPKGEGFKGKMGPGGGPMHMLEDLELTQEQKDSIKAKLEAKRPTEAEREAMKKQHEAMKKNMDEKLQSFIADTFDAKAFLTPPAGATPPKMKNHHLEFLDVVVSVLTPAQREKLAAKIEQGPPAPPAKK